MQILPSTDKGKLNEALESSEQSVTSWTRNLIEENTSLKEEVEALLMKYRELKAECSALSKKLESTKSGANVPIRDGTKAKEETSKVSQGMRADSGIKNVIVAKDDDVMLVDETASDDVDSDVVMSSRYNEAEKKQEQELTITEDVVQNSSYSPSMVRHCGSGGNSSTFKQSVIKQERNVAEEMQGNASFIRSLVEENEDVRRRTGQLCIENEELVTECRMMSKGMTYKANEVLVLGDRIRVLEEHLEVLQGPIGVLEDEDRVPVGHFSQTNCKVTPALSDGGSWRRSFRLNKKDILTQSIAEKESTSKDDGANEEEEEGRQRLESIACGERIDVIIEEEEEDDDDDDEFSLLDDDTLTDITLDKTLTEEEFCMELIALASDPTTQYTATPRKINSEESGSFPEKEVNCYGDRRASEDVIGIGDDCIVKSDGKWTENCFAMEGNDAKKDKAEREDCDEQQEREKRGVECKDKEPVKTERREDVSMNNSSEWKKYSVEEEEARDAGNQKDAVAIESNIRGISGGTHEQKKHMRDGTPRKGGEFTDEVQNHAQGSYSLTKFIEQVWSIIGGSRQIEDVVSVNGNNVCCDDDQVAKVAHVIWELKEENSELHLQQYELKEVVDFLNAEVKLAKEEVNDLKTSRDELEKERDELANMCRELNEKCRGMQDENMNISTTCQLLEEEHQLAQCLVKDLEQKYFQKEEMFLKLEDQCRNLQQEKSNLAALREEETADLEKKVTFWSRICGKLYSFLKKDNAEMAKVEERCDKISKLAKTERSRRKRAERKNKKLLRKDKIRSEILGSRAKISRRMGEKMLDLQIEIERLQSEIIKVKADRNGFEDSYKSAVAFSTELRNQVAALESRIKLFEQTLDRRTSELNKVLIDKKITSEELTRVRKVKREHKKKVEELIEERRSIAIEVEQQEGEIVEAMEKIKEKEMMLNLCKAELEKVIDKLKVEAENRRLLELSVKEEKMIREDVEQRLRGAVQRLNEAEERLEEAMKANEELENAIEAQQQEPVKSEKKRGIFGRWFRRRQRKSHQRWCF